MGKIQENIDNSLFRIYFDYIVINIKMAFILIFVIQIHLNASKYMYFNPLFISVLFLSLSELNLIF